MRELTETAELSLDPAAIECLGKTRSGVLNVLVGVGMIVALSGFVLRGRASGGAVPRARTGSTRVCSWVWDLIFVAQHDPAQSPGSSRPGSAIRSPGGPRFYWGHVLPAVVGALAAPLGLLTAG